MIKEKTVAELVSDDFRVAEVFKKHGIDFCCGGGKTVFEACASKEVDIEELEKELQQAMNREDKGDKINFNEWSLDTLINYIVEEHHTYVRNNIPLLSEFTQKVARVHGHANPEVVEIASLFQDLAMELKPHMMKEETILFPFVRQILEAGNTSTEMNLPHFGSIQNPINMMELEHDKAGEIMKEIRKLSNGYEPPLHACNTYRVSYFKLNEFEEDLHQHIHLENNLLFPKAVALEASLIQT